MAFTVNFYTFSKREKSTAQPTGAGKAISCTANEPMDLLAPEISLDWRGESGLPPVYNYAYIANFSRYYHVTGWTHRDGLWWAALRVDPLASWKSSIGSQNIYVFRSSAAKDGSVIDTLYPATTEIKCRSLGFNDQFIAVGDGTNSVVSVGIIGKTTGLYYRYMTPTQLQVFIAGILDDGFYNAVLGQLNINVNEYPEAKVAINPLQYISSIRAYPIALPTYGTLTTGMVVGNVSIPNAECYTPSNRRVTMTYSISLANLGKHPQASARGNWVNVAMAEYHLQFPGFGIMPLNPADVAKASRVELVLNVDTYTGDATLQVGYDHTDVPAGEWEGHQAQYAGKLGIDIPLSNVIQGEYGALSLVRDVLPGAMTMAGGLISANPAAVLAGGASMLNSTIGNAINSKIPHCSQLPAQGSVASLNISPGIFAYYHVLADDDNDGRGRPLLDKRTLSSIPGYIQGDADEVAISCTEAELREIRSAIQECFYYA